jgi:hypothetical protein
MELEFPRHIFEKYLYWISRKSFQWEKCCSVQTDGRTGLYEEDNIRSSQCLRTHLKVKIPEAQLRVFLVYVQLYAVALTLAYFPDRNRETYHQNFACVSLVSPATCLARCSFRDFIFLTHSIFSYFKYEIRWYVMLCITRLLYVP